MPSKNTSNSLLRILKTDPNLLFRYDDESNFLKFMRGNLGQVSGKGFEELRSTALKFLTINSDLFGNNLGNTKILQETEDPQGGKDLILQQYHGKHLVYGGSIRFHANKEGTLDSISNNLVDLTGVPLQANIPFEKAIEIAQETQY